MIVLGIILAYLVGGVVTARIFSRGFFKAAEDGFKAWKGNNDRRYRSPSLRYEDAEDKTLEGFEIAAGFKLLGTAAVWPVVAAFWIAFFAIQFGSWPIRKIVMAPVVNDRAELRQAERDAETWKQKVADRNASAAEAEMARELLKISKSKLKELTKR